MGAKEINARKDRVAAWARGLWADDGAPAEGPEQVRDRACELLTIKETPGAATRPVTDPAAPAGEPMLAVENQAEFPTRPDQGADRTASRPARHSRPAD